MSKFVNFGAKLVEFRFQKVLFYLPVKAYKAVFIRTNNQSNCRFIQQIFIMLSDSAAPVRNMATDILIMSYVKFGDKIKMDLSKAQIPEDKKKKLLKVVCLFWVL